MEPHRFERDLELRETHLSIRTTLRWIDAGLEPASGPEIAPLDAPALLEALRALGSDLERHFELEERGAAALTAWCAEHRRLAADLRALLTRLESSAQVGSSVPAALRSALRVWFVALARHEAAESGRGGA